MGGRRGGGEIPSETALIEIARDFPKKKTRPETNTTDDNVIVIVIEDYNVLYRSLLSFQCFRFAFSTDNYRERSEEVEKIKIEFKSYNQHSFTCICSIIIDASDGARTAQVRSYPRRPGHDHRIFKKNMYLLKSIQFYTGFVVAISCYFLPTILFLAYNGMSHKFVVLCTNAETTRPDEPQGRNIDINFGGMGGGGGFKLKNRGVLILL